MSKILQNSLFLTGSQIIARAVGFIYLVFLGRQLGVEQFGLYVFTISLVYNFVPVADFGIERLVMRDIAREPGRSQEYFSKLAPLKIFNASISVLLVIVLGLILKLSLNHIGLTVIFGVGLIPVSLATLIVAIAAAKERMKAMSLANVMLVCCYAIFGLTAYFIFGRLPMILLAYPLANLTILLFLFFNLHRWQLSLKFTLDLKFYRSVIKQSWVFGLINIGAVFYLRLTILVGGVYLTALQLGYYSAAFKFIDAGILVPQAIALALFPISSRLSKEDPYKLKQIYIKSWFSLFGLGLLAALTIYLFAGLIFKYTYGLSYLPAVAILRVLAIAIVLFFVNTVPGNVIQTSTQVKRFIPFMLLNYLIALLICLKLVNYGPIGLAWGVVAGELVGLLTNNYLVYRFLKVANEKSN